MKKSSIYLPLLFALMVGLSACTPESPLPKAPAFEHTYGGAANESAGDIVALPDGGFLIVGGSQDPKTNDYDLYIAKVDADGAEVVSHTHGDTDYNEVGWKIAPTTDGEYAILGTKRPVSGGPSLMQITLIDADFKVRWQASSSTSVAVSELTLQGASFFQMPDGNFIAGYGTEYFPVVVRFDAQGAMLDENLYNDYFSDKFGHAFCRAADSTFMYFTSARNYTSGDARITALQYDRFGNYTGTEEIYLGTNGGIEVHAVTVTTKGDFVLSVDDTYQGQHLLGIVSEDLGTYNFNADIYAPNFMIASELVGGNLLLAGYDAYPYRNGQNSDFRLQLFDSIGNQVRSGSYGGANDEILLEMAPIATGGAVLLGETQSYGAGGTDLYLVFFKE